MTCVIALAREANGEKEQSEIDEWIYKFTLHNNDLPTECRQGETFIIARYL